MVETPCQRPSVLLVHRRFRLTSSKDFKRVRRSGKSYAHPLVVLVIQPNELDYTRFGVSAGRAVENAVQRNRAKRLLREAVRNLIPQMRAGWDVLLIARRPLGKATFTQAKQAIDSLFQRANLLER